MRNERDGTTPDVRLRRRRVRAACITALLVLPAPLRAQAPDLPFAIGERLEYRLRVAGLGTIGSGAMWVEGPAEVRGHRAWLLRFDMKAGRGPFKASDRTASWIDPARMASLRYTKEERHPLSRSSESVELFPETRRWSDARGGTGESSSDAPLDELSFMYFLRTIPLDSDSLLRFDRHFDDARNPTSVRVVGREVLSTEAGEFRTVVLEMRVRDPRRYRGEGVIRIHLSDDAARIPVRIESRMPGVGTAVMLLTARTVDPVGLVAAHR